MTLTNRLTLFFLAALAVVLAAFSTTLYLLARHHLVAQLDGRVDTTMDTLVALAEIEPDGWDWEPELRRLPEQWAGDPPVWSIFDESGNRVDGSRDPEHRLAEFAAPGSPTRRDRFPVDWNGHVWRVARQTLEFAMPDTVRIRPDRKRYRTLVFLAAWPASPVRDELRMLAMSLAGVSAVVWLVAGLLGRRVCRRALAPVRRMTDAARRISTDDRGARLPAPNSSDELQSLAGAFNDLLARLEDSLERQRRFTGDASHQLRTPLAALLGQLEVALRRDRDAEEYRRALASAAAQAGRMREIVESLFFLARADAEARLPDLQDLDLATWLPNHVAEVWRDHPRFGDLRVECPESRPIRVRAQSVLLGQALGNLVDNAFKYGPPGSPVVIALRGTANGAEIAVTDEGPGIAPADAERIFTPFFRSEDARRQGIGGLGLGLAIADRIVRAMGGRIEYRTPAIRGCCFAMLLNNTSTTDAIESAPTRHVDSWN